MVPIIGLNSAQHKVLKKLRSLISAHGVREHSFTEYSCKIKHVFTSKKQLQFFSLPSLPTDTFQLPNQNQEETKKNKQ